MISEVLHPLEFEIFLLDVVSFIFPHLNGWQTTLFQIMFCIVYIKTFNL